MGGRHYFAMAALASGAGASDLGRAVGGRAMRQSAQLRHRHVCGLRLKRLAYSTVLMLTVSGIPLRLDQPALVDVITDWR